MNVSIVVILVILGIALIGGLIFFAPFIRRHFFEFLAVALIGGSLFFFKETLDYLARRDYVAALLVMVIGVAVISVGKEMARLALVQRD
jgi:hypothetical protein